MTTVMGYFAIQLTGLSMPVSPMTILFRKPPEVELSSQIHNTEYTTDGVIMGIIRMALKMLDDRSDLMK